MTHSIPSQNWPKSWLLQIHQQAVDHGYIFVEPISQANAESLRQRLYRMRRRSDKSTASFVPPEYHLVMIGVWEPGSDGHGRLPVIYNRLPDGSELPNIRPARPDEIEQTAGITPPEQLPPPLLEKPIFQAPNETLQLSEADISDYVATLRARAAERDSD